MTELFEAAGPMDHRVARGATGLLATFNTAGVLTSADVHVGSRVSTLAGEADEQVALAVALAVRAVRHGSVGVDLSTVAELAPGLPWPEPAAWAQAVQDSRLVGTGVLQVEFGLVYLGRYHQLEVQVADDLAARAGQPAPLVDLDRLTAGVTRVFPEMSYAEQREASMQAARQWTTVLTGGPGTGKTTAVAGLLALLAEQAPRPLRIALAAPTGKAAARLGEAVAEATDVLPSQDRDRLGTLEAMTLHRLLRRRPDNPTRFRHDRGHRLPHDVVVVDETSMISLTLMARLLEAVRPDARLVLVGDPDQLASVDAGAVLSDLVSGYAGRADSPVAALRTSHRFGPRIGALAEGLRTGDPDAVMAALRAGDAEVSFVEGEDPWPALAPELVRGALAVRSRAVHGDAAGAIEALGRHRLLCAHREGPYGVRRWNLLIEQAITEHTGDPLWEPMYPGRPLLVTANDYGLGLFNGDVGVVVRDGDRGLRGVFATTAGLVDLASSRLGDVETMHAMTVHKAQGSQADQVSVLLPPQDSPLLTRELFYTAVTRARHRVSVLGTEPAVRAAVARRVQRATGLQHRLDERRAAQ